MLPTVQDTAEYYRERNTAAVIFHVDAERETGFRCFNNKDVAEICTENNDILIPFASINPHKEVRQGAREAGRLVLDFGVRSFKFHPTMQGFSRMTVKQPMRFMRLLPKKAPLKDGMRPLILKENAMRILGATSSDEVL